MLGLMSEDKGLEKKSLQPVAADVLVGEEVAAQKGVEKLLSQLAMGADHGWLRGPFHLQDLPLGFQGVGWGQSSSPQFQEGWIQHYEQLCQEVSDILDQS
jgi:hypothetical protein